MLRITQNFPIYRRNSNPCRCLCYTIHTWWRKPRVTRLFHPNSWHKDIRKPSWSEHRWHGWKTWFKWCWQWVTKNKYSFVCFINFSNFILIERVMLFDQFRVPRAALLNRTGDVSESGLYVSPFKDKKKRLGGLTGLFVNTESPKCLHELLNLISSFCLFLYF